MQSAPTSFRRRTDHVVEEVGEAAGAGLVVAGLLVRQEEAGVLRAALARGQSPLGVEQNRAGVRRQHFRDDRLELFHLAVADGAAAFLGERLLQGSPLIHGSGGNHAARVRNGLHAGQFSRCEHGVSSRRFSCASRRPSGLPHHVRGRCSARPALRAVRAALLYIGRQ